MLTSGASAYNFTLPDNQIGGDGTATYFAGEFESADGAAFIDIGGSYGDPPEVRQMPLSVRGGGKLGHWSGGVMRLRAA